MSWRPCFPSPSVVFSCLGSGRNISGKVWQGLAHTLQSFHSLPSQRLYLLELWMGLNEWNSQDCPGWEWAASGAHWLSGLEPAHGKLISLCARGSGGFASAEKDRPGTDVAAKTWLSPRLSSPAAPETLGPRPETGRLWLQDSEHSVLGSTDLGLNITSVLYYHLWDVGLVTQQNLKSP